MTWKRNVLVVANVTATSAELLDELKRQAEREPSGFTLVIPATAGGGGREMAAEKLEEAVAALRAAGLEADGRVGAADPIVAVSDAWDPNVYDEIVVSTLPVGLSKWLHAGLPERVGKLTSAPVTHIVAQPPPREREPMPARAHEREPMGPLSVLGWGRPQDK